MTTLTAYDEAQALLEQIQSGIDFEEQNINGVVFQSYDRYYLTLNTHTDYEPETYESYGIEEDDYEALLRVIGSQLLENQFDGFTGFSNIIESIDISTPDGFGNIEITYTLN